MKTKFSILIALIAFSFSGLSQKKWDLKEAVAYAIENNISIKQQVLNLESSTEDVIGAKGNFLPNLSGSTGGNLNND